jgi:UDP:flavonoid glycosyltransferase YjiC (YdhE family)
MADMRVLFTTWAWPSHYFPMVPLAWALRAAGHDVRMTSQPELMAVMRSSGLPCTAVGRDVDVTAPAHTRAVSASSRRPSADQVADGLLDDAVGTAVDEARSMFRTVWDNRSVARPSGLAMYGEVAAAMVDDLLALAQSWRPDLVVFDPLTHAGPLVAELIGVPAVRNLFGPDVTYFARARGEAGLSDVLDRFGLDDLNLHGSATVDTCPPSLQISGVGDRIATRYVPYNGPSEVPSWLLEPPARPRICLTWGTSTDRLAGRTAFLPDEVVLACTKLAADRDAELVLAITPSQRSLVPELAATARVVESVPLDALLPTCHALVHQGGAGTMLTALRHGLPQIIGAQLVDQAANACRVVASGAGRTFAVRGLSADDLLAAGHALFDDPSYAEAAGRLRQQILDLPSPADIVDQLVGLGDVR